MNPPTVGTSNTGRTNSREWTSKDRFQRFHASSLVQAIDPSESFCLVPAVVEEMDVQNFTIVGDLNLKIRAESTVVVVRCQ